ncbi:MAG TPA: hypothetical protein VJ461_00515, partial [Candidatus Nanoarchaeia archaeon]|nr:hypothetical protein [Candidatus Nanoarchaeia archaeon]
MKFLNLLLILFVLSAVLIIAGCNKEKPECEKSTDCSAANKCYSARCVEGKCTANARDNCCGNRKCEASFGESTCTCAADCGDCSGPVKFNVTTSRGTKLQDAQYAVFLCENNICIVGVDQAKLRVLSLVNDLSMTGAFKAEALTTINSPFNIAKDKIKVEFSLKDLDPDVVGAITFTEMKILSSSEMMGRSFISQKLEKVGDLFSEELALTSAQSAIEEARYIDIEIFYEYVATVRGAPV